MSEDTKGCLYIIGTPIGNRADFSSRAVETLKTCDLVACEDTRKAHRLFDTFGVKPQTMICHDHNEGNQAQKIADLVESGQKIGLISEAGMPAISDPGFRVVREIHKRGLDVTVVPGPTAAMSALAVSGLPSDGFLYLGFLPPKKSARLRYFEKYKDFDYTLIFYESTHRITKFMDDLENVLGPDRIVSIARELTKLHETILTGSVAEVKERLSKGSSKGEFVVMIAKSSYEL